MLYIYVLGYDVDFGHMEALNLITNQGYAEKTVGYLACVLLLSETNEFLRLVINSVKNDLNSHNEEIQVRVCADAHREHRALRARMQKL
jgi:AP-2 complex subunit alpha